MYKYLTFRILILSCITLCVFHSCSEEKTIELDESIYGYHYFPLDIGKYWVYQIDSTIVDDAGSTILKTTSYVREEIESMYINENGVEEYRIERSYSKDLNGEYIVTDAWKAERNDSYASKTEENLRFIKLIFPIVKDADWSGNHFDELTRIDIAGERIWVYKDWGNYRIESRGKTIEVKGETYENVVEVLQSDFESDIERRYSKESYAPNVGLVKKEMIILDTQCICPDDSWFDKAEAGFILTQSLVEYN